MGVDDSDHCWQLSDSSIGIAAAPSYDMVLLCLEQVGKHAAVKTACVCSARKWGPSGMLNLRVSGVDLEGRNHLAVASSASCIIGGVFDSGVSLHFLSDFWDQILPCTSDTPWCCKVAHESHRCISIGGQPDSIPRAICSWGFRGIAYRRRTVTCKDGRSIITMHAGCRTADLNSVLRRSSISVADVDPSLTCGDVHWLLLAAGVQASCVRVQDCSVTSGRSLHVQMTHEDAVVVCQRPLKKNNKLTLCFVLSGDEQSAVPPEHDMASADEPFAPCVDGPCWRCFSSEQSGAPGTGTLDIWWHETGSLCEASAALSVEEAIITRPRYLLPTMTAGRPKDMS